MSDLIVVDGRLAQIVENGRYMVVYDRDKVTKASIDGLVKDFLEKLGAQLVVIAVHGSPTEALRLFSIEPVKHK